MRNKIPAREEVICDCCKTSNSNGAFKKDAHLKFSQHALDYLGDAAADGTVELDLCDECSGIIASAINQASDEIRDEKIRQS